MKRFNRTIALSLLAAATALAAPRAALEPSSELVVGEPAQLSVAVDDDSGRPATPHIDGARVTPSGQMSQTTIMNGDVHSQTSYLFTIVPQRAGTLDIPPIAVGSATTEAIHATVTDEPQPTTAPQSARGAAEPTPAFVRIELPSKSLYVGQAVPVTVRAYFRAGSSATLQGEPKLTSNAFTLSELSPRPAQNQVDLQGQQYLQVTWTGVLSPAKPSTGALGVELPVELAYRAAAQPQQRHRMRDLFGSSAFDSLFDDPFFKNGTDPFADLDSVFDLGAMQRRQVTLKSTAGDVSVAEVPLAGRPAGFTGAVGRFQLSSILRRVRQAIGEPATLTVRATGTGNFDRLMISGVDASPDLKTYPLKSTFAQSGASKLTGTKTFTQTVVPMREGSVTVPPLSLVFFDPSKRAFVTTRTEPILLQVAPAPFVASTSTPNAAPAARPETAATSAEPRVPGTVHTTLQPLVRRPQVWLGAAAFAALTVLLTALGFLRRSGRLARRAQSRRIDHAVARARQSMDRALAAQDRRAFFDAARTALQTRLGAQWTLLPEVITAADVEARMGSSGDRICAVLERADGFAYANGLTVTEPLESWRDLVFAELDALDDAAIPSPSGITRPHPILEPTP